MKIISVANQKGGVGKTTTTLNLGMALIEQGYKVLFIDLDPQASLTISIQLEPHTLNKTIYNVLKEENIKTAILADRDKFFFLPSNIDLAAAELELVSEIGRESKLKDALEPIKNEYDYVLIDCPPSLGLLSVNAFVASDYVIIPMACEYLALRGYNLLQNTIKKVSRLNPKIEIMGVLPTMYQNTIHHKEILEELRSNHKVFSTIIKRSIKFSDCILAGVGMNEFDKEIAEYYNQLAQEVINYGKAC
ncbi:MAG TPA: AAA family ATPase [Patescibacteria group bacterium]|nr:AAA family ATPase [Patescibacteria group bacterium]